jgi:hypothetical protein
MVSLGGAAMASFILVLEADEDPNTWIYVTMAESVADICDAECIGGPSMNLSKAGNPGKEIKKITRKSCEQPDQQLTGTIYGLN